MVSKELGQLAIEKLYKRIDIRLWSKGNTDWMLENLEPAKKHLRYTRELCRRRRVYLQRDRIYTVRSRRLTWPYQP
jgi:hypothetical protein